MKELEIRPRIFTTLSPHEGRIAVEDRRRFSYELHIPERRSGSERRSGENRLNDSTPRMPKSPKANSLGRDIITLFSPTTRY